MIEKSAFVTACDFVNQHHRHLKAPRGHKFSIAYYGNGSQILGVVIAGRPVNRNFSITEVIEFTRVCVLPGQKNLCSKLLATARRVAAAAGYTKAITYTRADETGASMKADNWKPVAKVKGRQWHGRKQHEIIDKIRWEHQL